MTAPGAQSLPGCGRCGGGLGLPWERAPRGASTRVPLALGEESAVRDDVPPGRNRIRIRFLRRVRDLARLSSPSAERAEPGGSSIQGWDAVRCKARPPTGTPRRCTGPRSFGGKSVVRGGVLPRVGLEGFGCGENCRARERELPALEGRKKAEGSSCRPVWGDRWRGPWGAGRATGGPDHSPAPRARAHGSPPPDASPPAGCQPSGRMSASPPEVSPR